MPSVKVNAADLTLLEQGPLAIVERFVADYDRPMKQEVALGLLWLSGAFSAEGDEGEALAGRVGAALCSMIRDDVMLDTFSAKMTLLASQPEADKLAAAVESSAVPLAPEVSLQRYIAVRWLDACGRIWYRIGNHTQARLATERAFELASLGPVAWWCWADIRSDLLRMQQEECRQVGLPPTVDEATYDEAIAEAKALAAAHLDTAPLYQHIEHLRGLWNLLHNRMVSAGAAHMQPSLDAIAGVRERMKSLLELPADAWVDPYREAQTLNQEALNRKKLKEFPEARQLYLRLRASPWPRGRFFARQHLPHLETLIAGQPSPEAKQKILTLCEEVRGEQTRPGGREGFDIDRYYWTVDIARQIVVPPTAQLREHDVAVSQAVQSVASVAGYKNAATQFVLPSLQREIDRLLVEADATIDPKKALLKVDEAAALIEESSARELLDLLSVRRPAETEQSPEDVFVSVDGVGPDATSARAGGAVVAAGEESADALRLRRSPSALTGDVRARVDRELDAQRSREEAFWLRNPIPTQPIDPEVSYLARQFSAETFRDGRGPLVVRYFKKADGSYHALVYFKGRMTGPIDIGLGPRKLAQTLAKRDDFVPFIVDARRLWEVCLEPIFRKVSAVGAAADGVDRIVIVPAGDLFALPLQVAVVPAPWSSEKDLLLGQWKPVSFSVSLASHVLRNRAAYRSCAKEEGDDLFVLFAGEKGYAEWFEPVLTEGCKWGPHVYEKAGRKEVVAAVQSRPEFLVLGCHGHTSQDARIGSFLELHGGVLSSFGIATRQWLRRNKLTVLAACVSGAPLLRQDKKEIDTAGEIASLIRAFVAAGCGALLVTNWSVLQAKLADATAALLARISSTDAVVQLDEEIRAIVAREATESLKDKIEASVFQLYL